MIQIKIEMNLKVFLFHLQSRNITPESLKNFADLHFVSKDEIVEFWAQNFIEVPMPQQLKFFAPFLHIEDLYYSYHGGSLNLTIVRKRICQSLSQHRPNAKPNFLWLLLSHQSEKEYLLKWLSRQACLSVKELVQEHFMIVLDNRITQKPIASVLAILFNVYLIPFMTIFQIMNIG